MTTLWIKDVTIINEGRQFVGSVCIEDGRISRIVESDDAQAADSGLYLLPGVIDEHVHFREPGLTHKADINSESRAAAAGGVTTVFDMPNCVPQTTTIEAWEAKMQRAEEASVVNYAFHFGATTSNASLLSRLDTKHIPAVKLFMGSSTGGMLVDNEECLRRFFAESPLPLMAHCEDTSIIEENMRRVQATEGADPDVRFHPLIRSREACLRSSELAVRLADAYDARLMVAHVTTAEELQMFSGERIVAEACVPHLLFSDEDYATLGTRIKCNPAVKTMSDREALRTALTTGKIHTVATDHAPHLLSEKQGGAARSVSGMPMVQFSLIAMLGLVDEGVLTMPRLVELMSHNPARFFSLNNRGFLREGYKADLVLVRRTEPWTLQPQQILSKCGWSPLEGRTFHWRVEKTFVNGTLAYDSNHGIHDEVRGEAGEFN